MTGPSNVTDSTIHDLGYRRYEGPRGGAREAWRALFWQAFRAMFGVGRPFKHKVVPVFCLVMPLLPTLAMLAASSAAQGQVPVRYGMLIGPQLILFLLFIAAQAPEVMSRDQQHRVLPLILTRNVTRVQYATARLGGLLLAMLCVAFAPLLLMYIGEIGIAADPAAAFRTMGGKLGPVLAYGTIVSWVFGSLGAALASLTARRAYATAAVIGPFLVVGAIATGMRELAGLPASVIEFVDPIRAMQTLALLLFNETTRAMELEPPPPIWAFVTVLTTLGAVGAAALLWRLRRVDA